jgi:flagellar motility protein MotE (MotC chaperone)
MSRTRLRIIPLTIVVASLFLMVKLIELIQGGQNFSQELLVSRVQAEEKAPEAHAEKPKVDTPGETSSKTDDHTGSSEGAGLIAPANPDVSSDPGDITDRRFSNVELELLQKLSKRREELQTWEGNLQIKEQALSSTEKRIDDKIAQIESMQKAVSELLAEYNKIEDAKIGSLVKIYENMKPAEAARIFDELEMPILLLVIDRMKEKKSAPVLAAMNTMKAKQVTVELAEQRRLEANRMKQAEAATKK